MTTYESLRRLGFEPVRLEVAERIPGSNEVLYTIVPETNLWRRFPHLYLIHKDPPWYFLFTGTWNSTLVKIQEHEVYLADRQILDLKKIGLEFKDFQELR